MMILVIIILIKDYQDRVLNENINQDNEEEMIENNINSDKSSKEYKNKKK